MNETQQKLIMVTERLLRTNGLARLTTRMIAGEAGVAEGLIYHYFSDKAGLIHEVIEQRINDVRNAMEKLPSLIGLNTVTDNLEKVMIVTYSVQYRMTPLMNSVFADSKVRERIREIADVKQMGPDKETENLAVYISAEQRLGRINCDIDSASAARLLLANCFMSATHDQFLGLDPDRKEVKKDIRSAIQTLMRGLEPGSKRIQKKTQRREQNDEDFLNCLTAAFLVAAMGCAVGPDFKSPDLKTPETYTEIKLPAQTESAPVAGGKSQHFDFASDISSQWWSLYKSPELNALIELAIKNSPTLAAAESALKGAQEDLKAIRGGLLYPGIDGNLQVSRQQTSSNAGMGPGNLFTLYNASVGVSYTLDVFGGSRRQIEAAQAQVDYQRFQYEAAWLSLTSNIITAAIREAMLRAQIEASNDIIAAEEKQLEIVNNQFILGAGLKVSVLLQQSELSASKASLPELEKQLSITRHALATLTGQMPSEAKIPQFSLDSLHLPEALPVSLPSTLARQRPDIRSAEAQLHQACAAVGIATANLYPQITIGAGYGTQSTASNLIFDPESAVWNLGAGLLQPLFHGGQLSAKRRSAIAAFDQTASLYRQTVLNAFGNVADVLRSLEADARVLKSLQESESAARQNLDLSMKQFELGAVNYLSLLITQISYNKTRRAMIDAQAQRYADTAALFQALGGGWWDRKNDPAGGVLKNVPSKNDKEG